MITVRPHIALDTSDMARLLNEIISAGGTTALIRPITEQDLADRIANEPDHSAWHVALDRTERIVGFQWITCASYLPAEAAEIATFVQIGQTGLGIG